MFEQRLNYDFSINLFCNQINYNIPSAFKRAGIQKRATSSYYTIYHFNAVYTNTYVLVSINEF